MNKHFRSIWISDTHLGSRNMKSHQLYRFLCSTDSEYLYLVGDIIDIELLSRKWYWPEINNQIINCILEKAKNGTKVVYLPGNHDSMLRNYAGVSWNNIEIKNETIHTSVTGKKYLILHGDRFDCVVQKSPWLAKVGGVLYELLLGLNRRFNAIRSMLGKEYFSLSAYLKQKCKKAVNYIGDFETLLTDEIGQNRVDGIVCGHIHHASVKLMGTAFYGNSGDWVESCTALAENSNGTFGIIQWNNATATEPVFQEKYEKNRYRDRCLAPTN